MTTILDPSVCKLVEEGNYEALLILADMLEDASDPRCDGLRAIIDCQLVPKQIGDFFQWQKWSSFVQADNVEYIKLLNNDQDGSILTPEIYGCLLRFTNTDNNMIMGGVSGRFGAVRQVSHFVRTLKTKPSVNFTNVTIIADVVMFNSRLSSYLVLAEAVL